MNQMCPHDFTYFYLAVHVADMFDRDDPDYLAALETETATLEKRVRACCSRIMVVTCFDVTAA